MPVLGGSQGATCRDIVGSVRELTIRNGALCGNLRWASDPEAQAVRQKYDQGHLRFRLDVLEFEVGGKNVVTRWMPLSVSLVASE